MIEKLYSNTNNNVTTNLSTMHTTMHPTALTTTTIYTKDYDVPLRHHTKKIYAKAIYDNIAESPDELAFKKGDILNVIEQDTDGLEGWWLCTLRGRQGICPGNRLRIINSYDSGCFSPSPSSSPCTSLGASTATLNSSILSSSDTYENTSSIMLCQQQQQQQRHGKRRSWHTSPHKVITPQKCGDVYLYDILSPRNNSPYQNLSIMSDPEAYDIPKPATPVNYDCPKNWNTINNKQQFHSKLLTNTNDLSSLRSQNDDSYDIPRPVNLLHQQDMTPSSSNSSLLTPDSLSLSSSNRSSLANMPDYDIPRRNPQSIRTSQNLNQNHHGTYDFPNNQQQQQQQQQQHHQSQFDKTIITPIVPKELPLELSSALETLAKLQTEATSAVTRLLAFVTPNWRTREKLEPILMDVKLAAVRLRTALHDLSEFGEGTLGNATRADDKNLSLKLQPLVKALRDADKLVHECSQQIDKHGWTLENLLRLDNNKTTTITQNLHHHNYHKNHQPKDSLDQLIACAQTLTEDVRQIASFIQGNATLLFKRLPSSISSTPITPTSTLSNNNEWSSEDYDYISLETKDHKNKFDLKDKNNDKLTDMQQQHQHQQQQQQSTINSNNYNNKNTILNANDKLLIKYYTAQIITHMGFLTDAIDSFLETVERNQPPKFFIAYGKFVVLSAHNLVSIGDIVHRNLIKNDIKQRVQQYTDALSDALKTCVTKSKKAAQHFPSVTAVQEMVDSVVDISHLARDLKVAMLQAVQA